MLILDRIEEDCAILSADDGKLCISLALLHPDAKEGDVVIVKDGLYVTDAIQTQMRRAHIRSLLKKLIT